MGSHSPLVRGQARLACLGVLVAASMARATLLGPCFTLNDFQLRLLFLDEANPDTSDPPAWSQCSGTIRIRNRRPHRPRPKDAIPTLNTLTVLETRARTLLSTPPPGHHLGIGHHVLLVAVDHTSNTSKPISSWAVGIYIPLCHLQPILAPTHTSSHLKSHLVSRFAHLL